MTINSLLPDTAKSDIRWNVTLVVNPPAKLWLEVTLAWNPTTSAFNWTTPNASVAGQYYTSGKDMMIPSNLLSAGQRYVFRVRAVAFDMTGTVRPRLSGGLCVAGRGKWGATPHE